MKTVEEGRSIPKGVYLDTPVLTAVNQIKPFFDYGVFDRFQTPIFLRRRAVVQVQRLFTARPSGLDIRIIRGSRIPMDEGVVFYPFNSQSNMNAVTQRNLRHVLTLHGESNKAASFRPAARLYDYICVAGPSAVDRYLQSGIFTAQDVDKGRLIQTGDSFVQRMPWLAPAAEGQSGILFYCPTWEGYGTHSNNHSSVCGGVGFSIAAEAAREAQTSTIVIKPHPYLGLLKPSMCKNLIVGVRELLAKGFDVQLALEGASTPLCAALRIFLPKLKRVRQDASKPLPVRLALTDVSGMESVLLVSRIPALVINHTEKAMPKRLTEILTHKTITPETDVIRQTRRYLEIASSIDETHRIHTFGYQHKSLEKMNGSQRLEWLTKYVTQDPFWCKSTQRNGLCR